MKERDKNRKEEKKEPKLKKIRQGRGKEGMGHVM
jgi:hypothetical protein